MSDMGHLEIVEQICSFLASKDPRWNDELTDIAAEYASVCREANDRLRRCTDYLRRGMRSEAVHQADCLPSLSELLPGLLFPEREQWTAACLAAGVPAPPRLQITGVDELAAAREREQQLQGLLTRHRILALAVAPVRERLSVARALAAKDPANPCWRQNIRDLEAARLHDLHDEAKLAFRQQDALGLEAIAGELAAHTWLAPVPDDLRLGVKSALNKLRSAAALETLKGLLIEILAAHGARSYDQCASLMSTWRAQVDSLRLDLPSELKSQIRPVAAWLSAETRTRSINQRMKDIQPILLAQEEQLSHRRAIVKRIRIGLAIGATAVVAIAAFLLTHSFHS
jgi:hypothetical protein